MIYLHFIEPRRVTVSFDKEAFIGREGLNVVVKTEKDTYVLGPDLTVSRVHARIFCEQGLYFIEDQGSLNGTRINGKIIPGWRPRVAGPRVKIENGDVVELGLKTVFRVEFEAETEEESLRKDKCSVLLLLRVYLLEALNKLQEIQNQKRRETLSELASIIEYIMNKETYVKAMEKAMSGVATELASQHLKIMKKDPHTYLNSPLINNLIEKVKSLEEALRKEYEYCLQFQRS